MDHCGIKNGMISMATPRTTAAHDVPSRCALAAAFARSCSAAVAARLNHAAGEVADDDDFRLAAGSASKAKNSRSTQSLTMARAQRYFSRQLFLLVLDLPLCSHSGSHS
jgi:hypothetical protein